MKFFLSVFIFPLSLFCTTFNVRDYRATGNGVTLDTGFVQNAVNAANAAGGGTVFFPSGTYLLDGIEFNASNITFAGEGPSSIIKTFSPNSVLFHNAAPVTGHLNVTFRDLQFTASDFTENHVVAISLISGNTNFPLYGASIRNCTFDNTNYAIFADRMNDLVASQLHLLRNAHVFVGSTVDGGLGYSWNAIIRDVVHYPAAGMTQPDAIIQLQRTVSAQVLNFQSRGLSGVAKGITVSNAGEGNLVDGGGSEGAFIGIEVVRNTVGTSTSAPFVTLIHKVQIDGPVKHAIFSQGTQTLVRDSVFSNGSNVMDHWVYNSGDGSEVDECSFFTGRYGNGIVFEVGTKNFKALNNHFSLQLSGGTDLYIPAGAEDYYLVQGNYRDSLDTSTNFIINWGTGVHRSVQNLNVWPN